MKADSTQKKCGNLCSNEVPNQENGMHTKKIKNKNNNEQGTFICL